MIKSQAPLLSIVVPVYNEASGLLGFHKKLIDIAQKTTSSSYEIIYCDDGSTDDSALVIRQLSKDNPAVVLLKLSRNFGKEISTTAGIHVARGQAIITLDADGQHPLELIPEFLRRWQAGARVVVGVRTANHKEGLVKRFGSKLFYRLFNRLSGMRLLPGSTDYRLIDRTVQREFMKMSERSRITRGLIDWLGFERSYIKFRANPRLSDQAGYSNKKLFKLAIDSIVSLSLSPLYVSAYIGAVVLPLSALLGVGMLLNTVFGDPLSLHVTGSAYIVVLILFLVGILLVSQGIIGLYLSHIHTETQNRPLYIIDKGNSIGIHDEN